MTAAPAVRVMAVVLVLAAVAGCGAGDAAAGGDRPDPPAVRYAEPARAAPGALCLTAAERRGIVRFPSPNGASLGGVIVGGRGRTGVVLAHSPSSDLCEWMPYARRLAGLGYRVLAFDLNGFASSTRSPGNPGNARYDQDVVAAANLLRARGASSVLLLGSMLGGLAVLVAAPQISPPVAGVIDMSGSTTMSGLDTEAAARRLRVPVLFVAAELDTHVDHPHLRTLAALADGAPERRVEVIPGSAGHPANLLDPEQEPRGWAVRALVENFLASAGTARSWR